MPRYRALLTDLDGVLRSWPANDDAIEQRFGLPLGSIAAVAFDDVRLVPAITGEITDDEWRERTALALSALHPRARAREAVAAWSQSPGSVSHDVLRVVSQRPANVKLVLVTNATTRLHRDLEALNLVSAFDAIVNSSAIGVAKTETRHLRCGARRGRVRRARSPVRRRHRFEHRGCARSRIHRAPLRVAERAARLLARNARRVARTRCK